MSEHRRTSLSVLEHGIGAAGYLWSAGLTLFTLGRPLVWLAGAVARSFPETEQPILGLIRAFLTAPPARSAAFMRGCWWAGWLAAGGTPVGERAHDDPLADRRPATSGVGRA